MKLALLSDIHGNHHALQAVLHAIKTHDVNRLLITGDFVGYYFWPQEVFQLLESWEITAIRGNHEDMLIKAEHDPEFLKQVDAKYGTGLRVALDSLTGVQINWLKNLPSSSVFNVDNKKILLCHGSPWDTNTYIYPDSKDEVFAKCDITGYDWVVLGHTHYPMERILGSTTIINPGSVGQARNRQPGAYWSLLDTKFGEIDSFCVEYDASFIMTESRIRHPELTYLANVLERT